MQTIKPICSRRICQKTYDRIPNKRQGFSGLTYLDSFSAILLLYLASRDLVLCIVFPHSLSMSIDAREKSKALAEMSISSLPSFCSILYMSTSNLPSNRSGSQCLSPPSRFLLLAFLFNRAFSSCSRTFALLLESWLPPLVAAAIASSALHYKSSLLKWRFFTQGTS
jgi:hypothetical protein